MCYLLIPIIVFLFIFCIAYTVIFSEIDLEEGKDFFQTQDFAQQYYITMIQKRNMSESNYRTIKIGEQEIYYESPNSYYGGWEEEFQYIIVNHNTQKIYTNIRTDDIEQAKQEMSSNNIYWNYEEEMINTSMESINQNNIKYQSISIDLERLEGYSIYTTLDETKLTTSSPIYYQRLAYDCIEKLGMIPCYFIPVLAVILLLMGIYLLYAIGHEKKTEEIYLNTFDKWSYEWIFIAWMILICILIVILESSLSIQNVLVISILLLVYILCYAITAVLAVTTIKRIKSKTFFKSFLAYKIVRWIKHKFIKVYEFVLYNGSISKRITIRYAGFILISLILASLFFTGIGAILLLGFWIWSWWCLLTYAKQCNTIQEALESIYQGKTDIMLNEGELKGVLKQLAIYINDIAGGFSNAIEESLKSERLKTELITNVSHDIKTPLTSIINYVDLLKKEDIQDEKIQEYLEILDQKSQRLKKLMEDLIEASKVSSGNVILNMEKINVKELMKQTIGEFKDRFEEKKLQIELNLPEDNIYIRADNKSMYRIIENLYSNITKYALENSRVYLDIIKEEKKLKIQMKNISKDKLNISADELMQRFVRGDKSRTTEGSGLGISISKSLTELQNGTFHMSIDGDLFKVEIEFELE